MIIFILNVANNIPMCPFEFPPPPPPPKKKKNSSISLRWTIRCHMFPAERKNKQTYKPEYMKPHKNTTKTNIKTHQEYKGEDQIYMEDR